MLFIFDPLYYGYTVYTYGEVEEGVFGFTVLFADGNGGDPVTSITINKGDNVLYMPVDLEIKPAVSGQVEASGTATLTFTLTDEDYIFPITNPFPQETKLKDLTCLDIDDMLFVWDSVYYGYTVYTYGEVEEGIFGFTVLFADGNAGDPITDSNFVVFGAGQGGMYMPAGDREWNVTLNY